MIAVSSLIKKLKPNQKIVPLRMSSGDDEEFNENAEEEVFTNYTNDRLFDDFEERREGICMCVCM